MKFKIALILTMNIAVLAFDPHFMKDPAISPDGSRVCFSYKSDLWMAPYEGGSARRLTSVDGDDSNPDYSPDGKYIAFNSNREGSNGVYVIPSDGGSARKIVTGDYTVVDWFSDSKSIMLTKWVNFTGYKLFKIRIDGSELKDLNSIGFIYGDLSKENDKFVFAHNGEPYREKMTGSQNGCIYLSDLVTNAYYRLVDSPLTERYPVYSKTGRGIYFAQSDGKVFQIHLMPVSEMGKIDAKTEKLTEFDTWSARDISIACDNDKMVYEYFDEIWTTDPVTRETKKIEIDINEDVFESDIITQNNVTTTDRFMPSSKGNWVLFKYKFDLFAVPFEGGEIKKITEDSNGIEDFVIMDDNETIYFSSLIKGDLKLFRTSVKSEAPAEMIPWSNDKSIEWLQVVKGKLFVYYSIGESRRRLAIKDSAKDLFEEIVTDKYVENAEISRDGNFIFYSVLEAGLWNKDIYIYDKNSGRREMIYSHVGWMWNMKLDPKEEFMFFNKDTAVYRVDLKKLSEFHFEKDKWKDIFNKAVKIIKEGKEAEAKSDFPKIDLKENEKLLINKPGMNYIISLTKDQNIYYINEFDNKYYFRKTDYQIKEDELIAELPGGKIDEFNFVDSTLTLFYLQGGKIKAIETASKKIKDTPFEIKYTYNGQEIYRKVFDEVHSVFKRWFYDPQMHGVDWDGLGSMFSEYLKYNLDGETFTNIVEEMIGEINSSHTGYYAKDDTERKYLPIAKIGAEFDYITRIPKGITVKKVYGGSVLKTVHGIEHGDVLLSIDDIGINLATDIESLLKNKVNDKIKLVFLKKDKKQTTVYIKGLESDYRLKYLTWVSERKAIVDELSGNQVGYVHIEGMSDEPLQKFIDDLYTKNFDKKALIIDIRYNGGGYTHDELIKMLTKKHYAYTTTRWSGNTKMKSPFDVWDKPSILMINRNSFSDAEIFPAIYKEFKLGKILGTPTSGAVIGTSSQTLIDGSSMRLPMVGWYTKEGMNLEGNGVQPDIFVDPTFNQIIDDDDVQLTKAVELMLGEIK